MTHSIFSRGSVLSKPFAAMKAPAVQEEQAPVTEAAFFESVTEDSMLESVSKMATQGVRQEAASAVMQWVSGGDSSFDELDSLLFGFAVEDTDDEDGDITSAEEDHYNDLVDAAGEFLAQFADDTDVELMAEDEEAADRVFAAVESGLADSDSDETLAEFAVRESMMTEAVKKVIRNGKVKLIKKPLRKKRLSSAQKAALKKARRKANTGAAKAARKKSMRARKSRGM